MQSVFTEPRFYVGVEDYLYLWLHMASKSMCEAVVEGMGGVWDRVATDRRNVGFDTGVKESVLAWNAPQPYASRTCGTVDSRPQELSTVTKSRWRYKSSYYVFKLKINDILTRVHGFTAVIHDRTIAPCAGKTKHLQPRSEALILRCLATGPRVGDGFHFFEKVHYKP